MKDRERAVEASDQELATARLAAETCLAHKAAEVVLYDLKQSSLLADFYLVCSGTSEPHLQALAGHLEKTMRKHGLRPRHIDGSPASRWIVVDYGNLLVHLFAPDMRRYYEIEKLWQKTAEVVYRGGEEKDEPVPIF